MNTRHEFWNEFDNEQDKSSAIHKHIDLLIDWVCIAFNKKVKDRMDFYKEFEEPKK